MPHAAFLGREKTKFVFIMIQPWKWKLNPGVKRPSPSTAPRAVRNTTRQRARSRSRKAKDRVNSSVVSYFTCIPRLKISIIHLFDVGFLQPKMHISTMASALLIRWLMDPFSQESDLITSTDRPNTDLKRNFRVRD
jgi:hypothetical protein